MKRTFKTRAAVQAGVYLVSAAGFAVAAMVGRDELHTAAGIIVTLVAMPPLLFHTYHRPRRHIVVVMAAGAVAALLLPLTPDGLRALLVAVIGYSMLVFVVAAHKKMGIGKRLARIGKPKIDIARQPTDPDVGPESTVDPTMIAAGGVIMVGALIMAMRAWESMPALSVICAITGPISGGFVIARGLGKDTRAWLPKRVTRALDDSIVAYKEKLAEQSRDASSRDPEHVTDTERTSK